MGYSECLVKPIGYGRGIKVLIKDIAKVYESEIKINKSHLSKCTFFLVTLKKMYYDIRKGTKYLLICGDGSIQENLNFLSNECIIENSMDFVTFKDKYLNKIEVTSWEEFEEIVKDSEIKDKYFDIQSLEFDGENFKVKGSDVDHGVF